MALKKLIKKKLKEDVVKNTSITRSISGEETVIKEGNLIDPKVKHSMPKSVTPGIKQVGFSKGCTLSMGNYEFVRLDCWLNKDLEPNESVQEAIEQISEIIDEALDKEVNKIER